MDDSCLSDEGVDAVHQLCELKRGRSEETDVDDGDVYVADSIDSDDGIDVVNCVGSHVNVINTASTHVHIATRAYTDKRTKNHPDNIIQVLTEWMRNHSSCPYPSMNQKKEFIRDLGLSRQQLDNWCSNYRRRHMKRINYHYRKNQ
jgi:uncharacterized protein YjiS (DUF1127 family)